MALPTAYLVTAKNVEALFNAIRSGKAPSKFTQRFLEDLGFKSTNDRLYINMLKALGFLSPDGVPTPRYYEFLDQSQSARVLAEAVEEAYSDLFQLRRDAQRMERAELRGKIKTLTQGEGERRSRRQDGHDLRGVREARGLRRASRRSGYAAGGGAASRAIAF